MRTIKEINEKIKKGKVVCVTAEEMIKITEEKGIKKATEEVDVVTTATFAPMCSSSVYFNIGHSKPRIKLGGGICKLNDVPAYCGFAAVDILIGASSLADNDPRNKIHPGEFKYGGAHVIEDLVSGKDIVLEATAYGTDCYPRKKIETLINIKDLNEVVLFNMRNCYQNYNVAVNLSDRTLYTYMGVLKPNLGNANYCSAGQISPLLKDPYYKTIGIGTKIFLGGGIGYVIWHGTQHNPNVERKENGIPTVSGGALAVIGDLKKMSAEWLRAVSLLGYGVSLMVGIGVPIPVLNEEICKYLSIKDEEIYTKIVDYSSAYPERESVYLGEVNYAQLKSGRIIVKNKEVPTGNLSSYAKAKEICEILKSWITKGEFVLTEPVAYLPGIDSGYTFKILKERPVNK